MSPDAVFQRQLQILAGHSGDGDVQRVIRSRSEFVGRSHIRTGVSSNELQREFTAKIKIRLPLDQQSGPQVGGEIFRWNIGRGLAVPIHVPYNGLSRGQNHADSRYDTVPQRIPSPLSSD